METERIVEIPDELAEQARDVEIIKVCKRHESVALRAYEKALDQPLPGTLQTALSNHLTMIRDCHKRLLQMP